MKKQCNYKEKCNVSKILTISICSFTIVSILMFIMVFVYYKQMQNKFEESINNTTKIVSHLQIKKEKDKNLLISTDLENLVSNLKHNDYDQFLREYYTIQIHWLNFWLTILTILLGILGIAIPICFIKFYEGKKEEISDLIQENKTVLERMKEEVKEVEKKKETMTKDIEEAKKYVEKAKESEKRVEVNRYFVSAMRESSKKNHSEALARINKALDLDPRNMSLFLAKADILSDLHRFSEAVPLYEMVIKNRPSIGVYNNYANTLADMNEFDKSIEMFSKAISLSPKEDYMLFSNRGMTYMRQGNTIKALEDFKKVLQLSPEKDSLSGVIYNIIECCLKNHDFKNSLIYLKKFMNDIKDPFIYDDDKPLWLGLLKNNLEQKEVTEIANLINDLKIKPRQENK